MDGGRQPCVGLHNYTRLMEVYSYGIVMRLQVVGVYGQTGVLAADIVVQFSYARMIGVAVSGWCWLFQLCLW